jgi:hypothetical protein
MRPDLTVFLPPVGNQYFGLKQCTEDFPVEQFGPQFAVEGLDTPVLSGTAWLDEERPYPQAA